jgi:hypothetical protein
MVKETPFYSSFYLAGSDEPGLTVRTEDMQVSIIAKIDPVALACAKDLRRDISGNIKGLGTNQ